MLRHACWAEVRLDQVEPGCRRVQISRSPSFMPPPIVDQVVAFFAELFESLFSNPFRALLSDPLRRRAVTRQIEEASDAASQSIVRLFRNQQLSEALTASLLAGFARLGELADLDQIANPNLTPEAIVENLLERLPPPDDVRAAGQEALYRVALHSIVQVLMLVAPVMNEWRKLSFAGTFELPRRVVQRLNQITEQLDAQGRAGQEAADERYELTYRDHLLQRFYRVEAGTVRMTTNLDVDLRELFVMPRVRERPTIEEATGREPGEALELMNLAAARQIFGGSTRSDQEPNAKGMAGTPALEQVSQSLRLVIVGPPGSGKSTFFEWLQLKLAAAEEPLILGDQQAIPLLLRVRQLDARALPQSSALIEKATASRDRAMLMPEGWIDRQLRHGRVLLLLDGLDETEPELRDRCILPWLQGLCEQYPTCQYLVSSRPVGYPPGALQKLGFTECDLLDFSDDDVEEYTRHWCTAVRLARNEPAEEARREGAAEGEQIVRGFEKNRYIRNLAHNPLMLSAICLVQYFEGGKLPEDRALLYRLCVEGLLHHWDQRRGIWSEYGLEEKLRACREVALAMQAEDRAEFPAARVREVFTRALGDPGRAQSLLAHVRHRTGLLLERRPGVFAFAHLTFQEYLAARAIHEGNTLSIDTERLVREQTDGRWEEVIALYCGLAPAPAARSLLQRLIAIELPKSQLGLSSAHVLTEAYLSAAPNLAQDAELRRQVLIRVAKLPASLALDRFPPDEAAAIANQTAATVDYVSGAFRWLLNHPEKVDLEALALRERLRQWRRTAPGPLLELVYLAHRHAPDSLLLELSKEKQLYQLDATFATQADWAFLGLHRRGELGAPGLDASLMSTLRVLSSKGLRLVELKEIRFRGLPLDIESWPEFAVLARRVAERADQPWHHRSTRPAFQTWASVIEREYHAQTRKSERSTRGKQTTPAKGRE